MNQRVLHEIEVLIKFQYIIMIHFSIDIVDNYRRFWVNILRFHLLNCITISINSKYQKIFSRSVIKQVVPLNVQPVFSNYLMNQYELVLFQSIFFDMFQCQTVQITCLLVLVLIPNTYALRFPLQEGEVQTFTFEVSGRHTLYVVSSGEQEHNVTCLIERNGEILFNQTGPDLQFSKGYGIGNINISFSASSKRQVSFDFYHDEDPLVNIIDKRDIRILEEALGKVHGSLMNVSRNQQFHIERDETHKETLQVAESHIKWTGVVKIVLLLASALLQLWIMKGFFANTHPYEPVATA